MNIIGVCFDLSVVNMHVRLLCCIFVALSSARHGLDESNQYLPLKRALEENIETVL